VRRCSSPAPLASLRNKLSGASEANRIVRLSGDQTGLTLRPGLEANRLGTPRSTSSIQRSVPTGLPRATTIRRPSGDRWKKALNAGSPTVPRGFPVTVDPLELAQGTTGVIQQDPRGRDRDLHLTRCPNPGHRIGYRMRYSGESSTRPRQSPAPPAFRRAATVDILSDCHGPIDCWCVQCVGVRGQQLHRLARLGERGRINAAILTLGAADKVQKAAARKYLRPVVEDLPARSIQVVREEGRPPEAATWKRPEFQPPMRIRPLSLQEPPRAWPTSQIVCGAPPAR
jgi:hypothetical protein